MKALIIFGSPDNEEQAAREIAQQAGLVLATATAAGTKVHGGTAYKADGFVVDGEGDASGITEVIIFECSPACAGALEVVAHCDHHNPGDAGWGKGAPEYWEASSLGQLCAYLGVEPTEELRMVAAGDHSPAGAYLGQCPGVDPEKFLRHRVAQNAAFNATIGKGEIDPEKILEAIEVAKGVLADAAEAPGLPGVRDMRPHGVVPELPEAGLSGGFSYIAEIPDTDRSGQPTGNRKVVIGGHTTPDTVRAFMAWAESQPNLVGKPYGNPDRGFAGAIYSPVSEA